MGVKSITSYQVMLLETSAWIFALQRVYRHITKVKNMSNHRLPHLAWSVGYKLQRNQKSKILSCGGVVDIKKWFKRWYVEALLKLLNDVMKYASIEESLMQPLRKKVNGC